MGNARVGDRHLLGDPAAQADHLDVFDRVLAWRPGVCAWPGPCARKASRSSWVMRPAGPVPGTWRRSTPASRALRRTAGAARGFSPAGRGSSTNEVPQRSGLGRPVCGGILAGQSQAERAQRHRQQEAVAGTEGCHSSGGWSPRSRCHLRDWSGLCRLLATFRRTRSEPTATTFADLGTQPNNLALDGRGNLHRRLVGHHRSEDRIFPNKVADLDVPLDELGFRDTLADIGQL